MLENVCRGSMVKISSVSTNSLGVAPLSTEPLKILHTYKIYKPEMEGGVPEVISTLVNSGQSKLMSSVLASRHFGRGGNYIMDDVPVTATSTFGTLASTPVSPGFPFRLHQMAKDFDVVVNHAPFPLADMAIASGFPKHVGLIIYWHAEIIGRPFLKRVVRPFINTALHRADRIIISHESLLEHSSELRTHQNRVQVVPFGTQLGSDGGSSLDHDQRARIAAIQTKHPRLVVFIGRLVTYKGIDVLIEAIGKIDADLVIIGQGPLNDSLIERSRRLGLSNRIFFLGNIPREDVTLYLRAAKVLALPSISAAEAFGIVQIEAMAAGCPVVNTRLATAVPHIARNGLEAITVRPQDPDELANALRTILDDPSLRARLSISARERAIAQYSAELFRARMEAIYHDVVTARGHLR